MFSDQDQVTALAAIYQAVGLAQQIARRGMADSLAMETSISSLFKIDAANVQEVFGGLAGLQMGLQLVQEQFHSGTATEHQRELLSYFFAVILLERRLAKQPRMLAAIGEGVTTVQERLQHFSLLHPNILAQFAELYVNTISTLKPRILVRGETLYLQNPQNVDKIRSLLLASVRASRLWHQVGGRRWRLLWRRKHWGELAAHLLQISNEKST